MGGVLPASKSAALLVPRHAFLTIALPMLDPQGQNKTYYHVKDIAYLLHEPLLKKARELHAYEKKVGGQLHLEGLVPGRRRAW